MANGMIKMACWFMVGTILMISLLLQPVANAEPGTRGLNPPPGSIVATIYIDADASPQRNLTLAKYNITPLVEYYSSVLAYANDTQITAMNRDGIWAGEDISRFWVNRSSWVNFDTRNGEPAMPADLRIDHYEPNTEGLYIIQLIGPPYQEWINTLKGNGVQIYWSVPPDNYIVRMNSNIEGTVRNLWFVQWVGIYQPAYKIEPNIRWRMCPMLRPMTSTRSGCSLTILI
ncbi:MAG: hypothetical protein HZB92_05460 [Euryarchaeota archaeon]|nr:hypothetical protein [Euryarchaeota archaeon]